MNITQIEEIVKKLASDIIANEVNRDEFIYLLMTAYGHRKTTIGRIKSGERNLAKVAGEVRAKRHIYFKQSQSNCVLPDIDNMKKEPSIARDKIRFVIATDFNQFVALDTRTHDTLDIKFNELGKHFDFFLPWAGMEKAVYQGENPADVKAAEKMAKLFDLIKADNFNEDNKDDTNALHNLNVFLTRLLFCFFAEDTGIFKQNQFSAELESHTKVDGTDVDSYLNRLFKVLNTSKESRGELPDYLANFEYVNGGLFANNIVSPRFSARSRKMLIECGSELDWSDINPDIFGSMIQAVVHPDQRGGMGMHYTSVTNIMKVIEPLFLDSLYAELENIEDNIDAKLRPSRLRKLHDRIAEIKIFDPACGSGNFLIIAFKELRKLEMEIIKRLQELKQSYNQEDLFTDGNTGAYYSLIKLSQFYGIELDDFAHEVAILSLWLAEHQMNVEFKAEFGECEPALPLKESGNIFAGNATKVDWASVCPFDNNNDLYILGNPPYLGARNQSKEQKEDMRSVFKGIKSVNSLDYISCWLMKAAEYIRKYGGSCAFVSTNSVIQGEHVPLLWPHILNDSVEIHFAHDSFKWENSAKNKAAVICVIIGLSKKSTIKTLFKNGFARAVKHISPYLTDNETIYIQKRSKPLSKIPKMEYGNQPIEGGFLKLEPNEKMDLIEKHPNAEKFIKRLIGGSEFLKGHERWCIWIEDDELNEALAIDAIKERIGRVKNFRQTGGEVARSLVERSHQFRYRHRAKNNFMLLPCTSSERREYIPAGVFSKDYITLHSVQALYDPEPYVFGIISSKMHMVWTLATSGRLKSDIRYSSALSYNTFPIPELSEEQKEIVVIAALKILEIREGYSDKTISELYDPDKMPNELLQAHKNLDRTVETLYSVNSFSDDSERLSCLITHYKKMTGGQNA